MGCCFSGNDETSAQGPVNERSPLISGDPSAPVQNSARAGEDGLNSSSTPISRTDEQSMLSRILHQTANNVIDVSSTEPHSLERTEYMERSRLYLSKLSGVNMARLPKGKPLPVGVPVPNAVLSAEPVSQSDINLGYPCDLDAALGLVVSAAKGAQSALSGFHVEHREPLVVAFGSI